MGIFEKCKQLCRHCCAHSRTFRQKKGDAGEQAARRYLEQQGLRFRDRNYLAKGGEIDLIMMDKETLVFVEVRLKSPAAFEKPLESITSKKQRHILAAAKQYIREKGLSTQTCRFDVLGISLCGDNVQYQWIKSAFIDTTHYWRR